MSKGLSKEFRTSPAVRLACAVLFLLMCVNALPQDDSETNTADLVSVYVLFTTQEGLLGPDLMAHKHGSWDELIDPFRIRHSMYVWRTQKGRNDVQVIYESLNAALGPFHFEPSTVSTIAGAEARSNWAVWGSEVVDSIYKIGNIARQAFRENPVDYVLGVDARYFVSPQLDRVRAVFLLKLAAGADRVGRAQALFTRQYEYLGPSIGQVLRPFHPGEKEALAAEVKEYFRDLTEENPENSEVYEEEEAEVLERLLKRDAIPPDLAIKEAWRDNSLALAVSEAQHHIQHMIALDLHVLLGPGPAKGDRVEFTRINSSGEPKRSSGYLVETLNGNTIYVDRKRNYYSVPGVESTD